MPSLSDNQGGPLYLYSEQPLWAHPDHHESVPYQELYAWQA